MSEEAGPRRLERWSWIASITSVFVALIVWLFPSPIGAVDAVPAVNTDRKWLMLRLGACALLVFLGLLVAAFNVIRTRGKFTLRAEFHGNWLTVIFPFVYDLYAFLLVSFALAMPFIHVEFTSEQSYAMAITLFLGIWLMIVRLRKATERPGVKGRVSLETDRTVIVVAICWFASAIAIIILFSVMFVRLRN